MGAVSSLVEGLVVALREGVEVALVIGILLAALRRTGRQRYTPFVHLGLGVAVLASLGGAAVVRRSGVNADSSMVEGALMLAAAAMVGSLVAWMWRTGRSLRHRMERRLAGLVSSGGGVAFRAALGVFAFAFLMVFREGVETVLFLLALASAAPAVSPILVGAGLGLFVATLLGVLLVRGSVRVDLRRFFAVTGGVLVLLVLKLVAGGLHEFVEHGLIPAGPLWEEILEVMTHRTTSLLVLVLLVTAPLAMLAWDWWRNASAETTVQ